MDPAAGCGAVPGAGIISHIPFREPELVAR
jgi:hypothetical protein